MDTSTLLAIAGIIITVILGGWSIYLVLRRRYPGRITFIREDSIRLFDSIVRNLSDLNVLYKGKPVSETLVLLKGYFFNTGSKDISLPMVEENLAITLPEEHKWLAAKIVSSSPDVKSSVKISSDTSLMFDFGLFRCNEYIRFEALAEVPTGAQLHNSLKFTHRIADTKRVDTKVLSGTKNPYGNSAVKFIGIVVTIAGFISALLTFAPSSQQQLKYFLKTDSDKSIEVKFTPINKDTLKVEGVSEKYSDQVLTNELFSKLQLEPKVIIKSNRSKVQTFIISFLLFSGIILIIPSIEYIDYKQSKNIRRLLAIEK